MTTMLHLLVLAMSLVSLAVAQASPCPPSWMLYDAGQSCFRAFKDEMKTWDDARAICQELGADLAEIRDVDTNDFVKGLLARRLRFWIGGRDTDEDGQFEYLDGTVITYLHWAYGEPNNHRGNERCLEIIGNKRGAWNDKRCSRRRPFVCQMAAAVPTTTTTPPPPPPTTPSMAIHPSTPDTEADTEFATTAMIPLSTMDSELGDKPEGPYSVVTCDFESPCSYHVTDKYEVSNQEDHTLKTPQGHLMNTLTDDSIVESHSMNVRTKSCLTFWVKNGGGLTSSVEAYTTLPDKSYGQVIAHAAVRAWEGWVQVHGDVGVGTNIAVAFRIKKATADQGVWIDDILLRKLPCHMHGFNS